MTTPMLPFFLLMCGISVIVKVDAFPRREERNVALKAMAMQSSTGYRGSADKAVDGIREINYYVLPCTHTSQQNNPWWRVDLAKTYNITRIAITNRGDCCAQRLDGAQIRVGNSLENNGNSNKKVAVVQSIQSGHTELYRLQNVEGRFVNIFLPGRDKYLTLCEVAVYADVMDEQTASLLPEEAGLQNLAKKGRATQSSLHSSGIGVAGNGNDGNRNSDLTTGSCTQTAEESSPWWRVNLHRGYIISTVALTNRGDCCSDGLDGAEIRIGYSIENEGKDNPICDTVTSIPAGQTAYFNCGSLLEGSYVTIVLPKKGILSLCEVEVFGYKLTH